MIGSLSEQIAKWLKSKKIIEAEDVDVCGYGIFWLLNIIEFLLVSVILGTVLRILPGALAFFISFLLLRLFGGGFHMDTELKCQITSLAIITAFIIAVKMTAVQKASFFMLLAAAAGTVTIANGTDPWGGSYGYHVKLDHGGGTETLYAHCSAIAVTAGQRVRQGEVIGYVGSTGNGTGNHLHFEVDVDGASVDPFPYLND